MSKEVWLQRITLPLTDIKIGYLDSLTLQYKAMEYSSKKFAESISNLNEIVESFRITLDKKGDDSNDKTKSWANQSPVLKGASLNQSKIAASNSSINQRSSQISSNIKSNIFDHSSKHSSTGGTSMPLLSNSPSPTAKKSGLKEKFKRLTGMSEPKYSDEYNIKLRNFLHSICNIENTRNERVRYVDKDMKDWNGNMSREELDVFEDGFFVEHLNFLKSVVVGFIISDLDILMNAFIKKKKGEYE